MDAVIFDVDGVLVDSEPLHLAAANHVLSPFGINLSEEENQQYLGMDESSFWKALADRYSLDADPRELAAQRVQEVTRLIRQGILPLPGVPELISGLVMRGLSLATASASDRIVVEAILDELGLARVFQAVVCGDDVERSKPEPDVFLRAARELGIAPEDCLVIEDSLRGITAARNAGMTVAAVRNRDNQHLDLQEADRIFSGLDHFDWTLFEDR